jgi:hypothetical protein
MVDQNRFGQNHNITVLQLILYQDMHLKILEMIDIQIAQKRYQNVKKKTFCKRC